METVKKYCFDRLFGIPECKYQCKKCETMENYERLTIELLGNRTPREKYEYVKWLIKMHELYTKTKLSLEDDMEYFGNTNRRHEQALRTYNILNGTLDYVPKYEDLRKEFYKVLENTEPFGNEYHDELFNWMWSKIRQQLECNTPINNEEPKCYELEQKLSACEIVLDETQDKLKHLHNKIMVQWEKDFGSIHNEQNMDAYTVSGFVRNILGTDRQT